MKFRTAAVALAIAFASSSLPISSVYAESTLTSFITSDAPDYFRASKLDGVNVFNDNNDNIGSVSEVLISRSGKAEAVVIGVGGFLGIGEHLVAVPYDAIKWTIDNTQLRKGRIIKMPFYIISRMERTSYTENAKDAADALLKLDRATAAGYIDARCIDKEGHKLSRTDLEAKAKIAGSTAESSARSPR